MTAPAPTKTAVEWASTVTPRHYRRHREELDELILATVPGYAAVVASTLDEFEVAVRGARVSYDEEHSIAPLLRPLRVTWLTTGLFWLSLLGGIVAFAVMVARPPGPSYQFQDARWDIRVPVAAISFAAGVIAQLIRGLPIRRSAPPRRDVSLISTAFGIVSLVLMVRLSAVGVPVESIWTVITAGAVAASLVYAVLYVITRRRDRELTRRVDSLEEDRLKAAGKQLEQQADEFADRLEADFDSLAAHEQKAVRAELSAATAVLRRRCLIGTPTEAGARLIRTRATRSYRPAYPGFLLLEKKVQQLCDLKYSLPGSGLRVYWSNIEYAPQPRSKRKSASR